MSKLSNQQADALKRARGHLASLSFRLRLIDEHEPDTDFWLLDNLRHALMVAGDCAEELRELVRQRSKEIPAASRPGRKPIQRESAA